MTVIAAVDESEAGPIAGAQAGELAQAFDEELHLVHVLDRDRFVELERTSVDKTGEGIEVDIVREIAAEIADEAGKDLSQSFQSVGLFGDVGQSILDYADDVDATYIVVAGRKRSPVGKAVFGDVGQNIILNANQPVVVVPKE